LTRCLPSCFAEINSNTNPHNFLQPSLSLPSSLSLTLRTTLLLASQTCLGHGSPSVCKIRRVTGTFQNIRLPSHYHRIPSTDSVPLSPSLPLAPAFPFRITRLHITSLLTLRSQPTMASYDEDERKRRLDALQMVC
jgi:hypothetical protein